MPLGRRSLDSHKDDKSKSPSKRSKLGRNIEEMQKFFNALKLAKPKIDSRWTNGTPLRSKSRSPVDGSGKVEKKVVPTKRPRRLTIGSIKEINTLKETMNIPQIVVNADETYKKSNVDFSKLYTMLNDRLNMETDEEKKVEIAEALNTMQQKFGEMENIVEYLQEKTNDICELLDMDVPKRESSQKQMSNSQEL